MTYLYVYMNVLLIHVLILMPVLIHVLVLHTTCIMYVCMYCTVCIQSYSTRVLYVIQY